MPWSTSSHVVLLLSLLLLPQNGTCKAPCTSALGDPGMTTNNLRVAFEGWNFCNGVGSEAPNMGSPRAADCFNFTGETLDHKVVKSINKLGKGKPFPGLPKYDLNNSELYAVQKELYLGSLCKVEDNPSPWHFWMVMLKNGNFDTTSGLCPENGKKVEPFPQTGRFPCFGKGCMNQPLLYHEQTKYDSLTGKMKGWFNGTYDLDGGADWPSSSSYFEVVWEKKAAEGSWLFQHKLRTTKRYPWLMLYLRADATRGFSGGYRYETRGMMKILPESPNFKVRLTLDIKNGGGPKSQFYLLDMGSCWRNDGSPCDGDAITDVTRYSEMIINPQTRSWCDPNNLQNCPPYHIDSNGQKIHRNDSANFPYGAYHYYCAPGNALYLEEPYSLCDPYSNPQAQEIVQILPHPVWAGYGYPSKQGEGWIGDPRTWELDVGGLSSRLYFYQDPNTPPARRIWTSLDVGTEIFISNQERMAEWTLSDFDVLVPIRSSVSQPKLSST